LIKPFLRVGIQLSQTSAGKGVIGVIEADFLQPTHNKQDFDYTVQYRACITKLTQGLQLYWKDLKSRHKHKPTQSAQSEDDIELEGISKVPDETWACCDACLKWRRLGQVDPSTLPEKWYCNLNPNPEYASCSVKEEIVESENTGNLKQVKKKLREEKEEANKRRSVHTTPTPEKKRKIMDSEDSLPNTTKSPPITPAKPTSPIQVVNLVRQKAPSSITNLNAISKPVQQVAEVPATSHPLQNWNPQPQQPQPIIPQTQQQAQPQPKPTTKPQRSEPQPDGMYIYETKLTLQANVTAQTSQVTTVPPQQSTAKRIPSQQPKPATTITLPAQLSVSTYPAAEVLKEKQAEVDLLTIKLVDVNARLDSTVFELATLRSKVKDLLTLLSGTSDLGTYNNFVILKLLKVL
jgi:hypothetical protein